MKRLLLSTVVLLILATVSLASAQTVVNPGQLLFDVNQAEHDAVVPGTQTPLIDHYEVTVMNMNAGGAIVWTQSVGKPTPDANHTVHVAVSSVSSFATITKNVLYNGTVSAIGTGGNSPASDPSNPFVFLGPPLAPGRLRVQ
jgi:hypothetical protein